MTNINISSLEDRLAFKEKKLASIALLTFQLKQAMLDKAEDAVFDKLFKKINQRTNKEWDAYAKLRKERGL